MGIHALVRNKKKATKLRSLNKWHRAKKAEKKKKMPAPVLNVEDAHLFSVDKMKNKLRNPRNNIAISGKTRNRLMKRLRHNVRERSAMEVEVTSSKLSKCDSDEPNLDDEEMGETDVVEPQSTDVVVVDTQTEVASSSKKKKRSRRKGKKGADVDVDMEED